MAPEVGRGRVGRDGPVGGAYSVAAAQPPAQPGAKPKRAWVPESPEARRRAAWRLLGIADDAFTIGVSIADIATDVVVLVQFQQMGYQACFIASMAIFAIAQVSYAFLFAASFASHRSPMARVAVFLAVLPLAQLVPVFTWLEAMRVPRIDRLLRRLGLEPSSSQKPGKSEGDSLWGFLQTKYQSHAGFLVEAFVEAVPQAVLQTVFAVATGQGTALNAASVGISIFTIASKGYLVSYALDNVTFLFNFLCIVADCFGLFAAATILALDGFAGGASRLVLGLVVVGLGLCVVAGHGLLWFTIFDDHLKIRHSGRWPAGVRGVSNVFFDLYLVRFVGWFLAIIPCIVLFVGARLSLLPVLVLKSIDPDLVRHARFFRGLLRFLRGHGGGMPGLDARLWTVNTYLAKARRSAGVLATVPENMHPKQRAAAVCRWAFEVGSSRALGRQNSGGFGGHAVAPHALASLEQDDEALQRAILESLAAGQNGAGADGTLGLMRARIRRLRLVAWLEREGHSLFCELADRSEVFHGVLVYAFPRPGVRERSAPAVVLRALACLALFVCLLGGLPALLVQAMLLVVGVVFPVFKAVPACLACSSSSIAELPCGLGAAYCAVLACVAALAPVVMRRHAVWLDVSDLRDFPESFYGGAVLSEIRRRHMRDSVLRLRLGYNCAQHTLSFLDEG